MATGGREGKRQRNSQLTAGRLTHDGDHTTCTNSDRDDSDSDEDSDEQMETADHVDATTNTSQLTTSPNEDTMKKRQRVAMKEVHHTILPDVLHKDGWKKVYDKDKMSTYKALYFNKIGRQLNETEVEHNQWVGEIRVKICEKVEELQARHGVKFKINTLLSKAILYDNRTLF